MMIGYVTFPLNLAMFVVGEGIGDPASVGLGMSLVTIVGALVGLILPQIIKMFKLYISALGAAFGFLSTVCVIVAGNMMMVYVVEKSDALGGMLKFADKDEHKYDLANYLHYLRRQVGKRAINVRLNTEATVELIEREKPYAVICGVGAQPVTPRFPGMDRLPCMHALEAYEHPETVKSEDVVVIGGGLVGCEVAVFLGARGKKVSLVEMQDTLAPEANRIHKDSMMEALTDRQLHHPVRVHQMPGADAGRRPGADARRGGEGPARRNGGLRGGDAGPPGLGDGAPERRRREALLRHRRLPDAPED